jgi:2-methylfumaryl-CoA hydratase
MTVHTPQYGRLLEDFEEGETYAHPWEVTLDDGMLALFAASFLDACPTYASARFARELGFKDRPVHPLLLMNLGLSFSVHDVSEQAIAHLAYLDVCFPNACHAGDTVVASSKVLGVKPSKSGDRGVVHVRTVLETTGGSIVCTFERMALVRTGGPLSDRPEDVHRGEQQEPGEGPRVPEPLRALAAAPRRRHGFAGFYEDFEEGEVICHPNGKTIGESEHMQLTLLVRNSHPIHFDELYCKKGGSFAKTRVVYGGLVFATVASLASRDVAGNVLWDLRYDDGAHPSGVVAGDTVYAASEVQETREVSDVAGEVTFRLVGTKNARPEHLIEDGHDLFTAELEKSKGSKVEAKVFEVTRTVLMLRRPG